MSMNIDWTHKGVKITDIRKVKNFYIIKINDKKIDSPLFVSHSIFEGRINSYYLRDHDDRHRGPVKMSREEVLGVEWNMVITKGYFMKIKGDDVEEIYKDADKFYISFLEIDGPLGTHISN